MNNYILYLSLGASSLCLAACTDVWDEHYDKEAIESTEIVEVYRGTVADFISGQSNLSQCNQGFSDAGFSKLLSDNQCTAIVCENRNILTTDAEVMAQPKFAANLISDQAVGPSLLVDGYGVTVQSGKNLWVTKDFAGTQSPSILAGTYLNDKKIIRIIKANNGYIYYVDGVIPVEPSIYEYIQSLGDDYSMFKSFIAEFEESYFDADASTPGGVNDMGETVYSDSVVSVRNTLMDRYTIEGVPEWDMRSESYYSTCFLPDNTVLSKAYYGALDSLQVWCNRPALALDSLRFRKWIVESCFVDRKLQSSDVAVPSNWQSMADNEAVQFDCVGGFVRDIDETLDKETFSEITPAIWNPAIQLVDDANPVILSNGLLYNLKTYKIPNHIVIWRVKSRIYQLFDDSKSNTGFSASWKGFNNEEDAKFTWNHLKPCGVSGLLSFNGSGFSEVQWAAYVPSIDYMGFAAYPDEEAVADSLPVSVEFVGLIRNTNDLVSNNTPADGIKNYPIRECRLPAGEYYLRMGGTSRVNYSFSVYFGAADEELDVSKRVLHNLAVVSTGANFLCDRGGAMPGVRFYGEQALGSPMDFDPDYYYYLDKTLFEKAYAYDTDGQHIATVTLPRSGNFRLKMESEDLTSHWTSTTSTTSVTNYTFCLYHWCLRPTTNNY